MDYEHPSWLTLASTGGSYLLILLVMTALLFLIPYAIFVST